MSAEPTTRIIRQIRGITLRNPWPWCITHAGKRVENRTWTPREIGPGDYLAIHAGSSADDVEIAGVAALLRREMGVIVPAELVQGAIVAVCVLGEIEHAAPFLVETGRRDPWWCGPVGWRLARVVVLPEPVPCRGAQGLWTLPEPVLAAVKVQWRLAEAASKAAQAAKGVAHVG